MLTYTSPIFSKLISNYSEFLSKLVEVPSEDSGHSTKYVKAQIWDTGMNFIFLVIFGAMGKSVSITCIVFPSSPLLLTYIITAGQERFRAITSAYVYLPSPILNNMFYSFH